MASGETTVFAQGEGDRGGNTSFRGGLGVNFPSGSSVRLLVAQRPTFERIQPGELVTTTAATALSGGYHGAAATSDGVANSIGFSSHTCTAGFTNPTYIVTFTGVVDSQNKDTTTYPLNYTAEMRWNAGSAPTGGWGPASEGDVVSCAQSGVMLPYTCYIQVRTRYTGTDARVVSMTSKKCTCSTGGSCTISDF